MDTVGLMLIRLYRNNVVSLCVGIWSPLLGLIRNHYNIIIYFFVILIRIYINLIYEKCINK